MSTVKHEVRSRFNYDAREVSKKSALHCYLDSRAVQDAADEADINTIVRKFGVTGKIPVLPIQPQYGDFNTVASFHEAMNLIAETNELFDSQPATIRDKFANNPQNMIDFLENPDNIDESIQLGLRIKAPVVDDTPSSAPPSGGTDAEGKA